MREEGVGDDGHVGLCEEPTGAHSFQEYFFVYGAQVIPQALVVGEVPGYARQATILKRFYHFYLLNCSLDP